MLTIGIIIGLIIVAPVIMACAFHALIYVSLAQKEKSALIITTAKQVKHTP